MKYNPTPLRQIEIFNGKSFKTMKMAEKKAAESGGDGERYFIASNPSTGRFHVVFLGVESFHQVHNGFQIVA